AKRGRGRVAAAPPGRRRRARTHRCLPPPVVLAGEARLARRDAARRVPRGGALRLLLGLSPRRRDDEHLDGVGDRAPRPDDERVGRRAPRGDRPRARAAAAARRRPPGLDRRHVLESRRRLPRPWLFLYRFDESWIIEGGALSDGGNLHAWLERTLADASGSITERSPD